MNRRRRIQIFASVIVAIVMTFAVALLSFELRGTELLRWSEKPLSSSYRGTIDASGFGWNSFGFSGFGWDEIEQEIVTPADPDSSWAASTAAMPSVPYWASAAELPVPRDDSRFCPECRMNRVDGAFGWPLRVVAYRAESVWMENPYAAEMGQAVGYTLKPTMGWSISMRLIPIPRLVGFTGDGLFPGRILWLAFIVNTAFYAAVLWTPFFVRRLCRWMLQKMRARTGTCLKCGYDVTTQPDGSHCPECGTAVVRSGRSQTSKPPSAAGEPAVQPRGPGGEG